MPEARCPAAAARSAALPRQSAELRSAAARAPASQPPGAIRTPAPLGVSVRLGGTDWVSLKLGGLGSNVSETATCQLELSYTVSTQSGSWARVWGFNHQA